MEGALTVRQVINEGESSFATEPQEELEETPSPVVDENNIVSAKKQGPNLHNWSSDWSFWIMLVLFRGTFCFRDVSIFQKTGCVSIATSSDGKLQFVLR
ncbi:protein Aster-C [Leptonychotes weddellii]|uniref:Protein Aster-C n=1 Tax=Leptonychotes weddellii TaxID=9713 RepID=A0A7F8RAT3_LEPWE|nr:protein Aster-C [Leptonychotes weddellii]